MSILSDQRLDAVRILLDLQQANEIARSIAGCLEPESIACRVTQGLVDRFGCAFARLWLLESDRAFLKLVASAGMYTRTDGFFGRIPMGAYKVGKIAQNRVSFLSNNLPAEPWVGNREWAVANSTRGFAGYPLAIGNRVIGVLAMFSHHALEPEFLEVLQTLCTIVTIALDTAIQCQEKQQKEKQSWQLGSAQTNCSIALSDHLAEILSDAHLTLLGTEQPLSISGSYLVLKTAEILRDRSCTCARLIYGDAAVLLEAIVSTLSTDAVVSHFCEIQRSVSESGGTLQIQPTLDQRATQINLTVPFNRSGEQTRSGLKLQIQCSTTALQIAFTYLAITAGITLSEEPDAPLLTDRPEALSAGRPIIWTGRACPSGIRAKVDCALQPQQFRRAVEAVMQGETWGIGTAALSERELEILKLLTQGHRDRDIAGQLMLSESTVKFHLNNALGKLRARTRYQAIAEAVQQGWIEEESITGDRLSWPQNS